MTSQTLTIIEAELKKRQGVLQSLFQKQREAADDPSRLKAYLTTRRAGKTRCAVTEFLAGAVRCPNSHYIHIGKTAKAIRNSSWRALRELNVTFHLNARMQETYLRMTLPNGSELELQGADKADWIDRMRGPAFDGVNIDEAAFYRSIDLRSFVREVVRPATIDRRGSIVLTSTPGRDKSGYFYDITYKESEPGWSVHRWSAKDNPYTSNQFQEEIEALKAENPNIESEPFFKREYLGEWAFDESAFVYAFDPDLNLIDEFEPMDGDRYVVGVDLGYAPDATAFSLITWNPTRLEVVELESFKSTELGIDQISKAIRSYQERFPGCIAVGDAYNKQVFEEIRKRHNVPIIAGQKTDKFAIIELINADFRCGRIKILTEHCEPHLTELERLTWLERSNGRIESPVIHNDACDAFCLAFKLSRHYSSQPVDQTKPKVGSEAWLNEQAAQRKKEYLRRLQAQQRRQGFRS